MCLIKIQHTERGFSEWDTGNKNGKERDEWMPVLISRFAQFELHAWDLHWILDRVCCVIWHFLKLDGTIVSWKHQGIAFWALTVVLSSFIRCFISYINFSYDKIFRPRDCHCAYSSSIRSYVHRVPIIGMSKKRKKHTGNQQQQHSIKQSIWLNGRAQSTHKQFTIFI